MSDDNGNNQADNPVPVLAEITPDEAVRHSPTFTLTVNGSQFVSGSKIIFNGREMVTTFVNAAELTCLVEPANSVASATAGATDEWDSPAAKQVQVLVRNPAPGGGDSGSTGFTLYDNHTFSAAKNLTGNDASVFAQYPDIAVDSQDYLYVVWDRLTTQNDHYSIYFKKSTDSGSSWTSAKKIAGNVYTAFTPSIAITGNDTICVTWIEVRSGNFEIICSLSKDHGSSWSAAANLSKNHGESYGPQIAAFGDNRLAVVWHDKTPGDEEIYWCQSSDSGTTWTTAKAITNTAPGRCFEPEITFETDKNIILVWRVCKTTPMSNDVYFQRSTDNGATWSTAKNISNNPSGSYHPVAALNSANDINIAWYDGDYPNQQLLFKRSTTHGSTWSAAVTISAGSGYHQEADIRIDSAGNINLVWPYHKFGDTSKIYYSRSIDNGTSWSSMLRISNVNGSACGEPAITVNSEGRIFVVWEDRQDGPFDIFFVRSNL